MGSSSRLAAAASIPTDYTGFYAFQVKTVEDGGRFEGYASVFGNTDLQGDVVEPGAFSATIKESGGRVPILFGHSSFKPIGFGLEAEEDAKGLRVLGEFTLGSDDGRNAYAVAKHAAEVGHKLGLSIGYSVAKGGAADAEDGTRKLSKLDLWEYSLALFPANRKARVTRVKAGETLSLPDVEDLLQEAGFSKVEVRRLIFSVKASGCEAPKQSASGCEAPKQSQQVGGCEASLAGAWLDLVNRASFKQLIHESKGIFQS